MDFAVPTSLFWGGGSPNLQLTNRISVGCCRAALIHTDLFVLYFSHDVSVCFWNFCSLFAFVIFTHTFTFVGILFLLCAYVLPLCERKLSNCSSTAVLVLTFVIGFTAIVGQQSGCFEIIGFRITG